MNGTGYDWASIAKTAPDKLILCADREDQQDWIHALSRAMARDDSYEYLIRKQFSEILVVDNMLDTTFMINFYGVNQWSWVDKCRGLVYDEIILTGRGKRRLAEWDDFLAVASRRKRTKAEAALYFLTQNDSKISGGLGSDIGIATALDDGGSMTEEFDLPMSLFRRRMIPYFENRLSPTKEEFVFALTMEGISGNSDREKKAIEEAQIYIGG